jgi:hypothetical protein
MKTVPNDWDDSLRYNCQLGKHYVVANTILHTVRNSYVITDRMQNGICHHNFYNRRIENGQYIRGVQ